MNNINAVLLSSKTVPAMTDRQTDGPSYPTSSVLLWKIVDMANTVLRSSKAAANVLQSLSSLFACKSKGYL